MEFKVSEATKFLVQRMVADAFDIASRSKKYAVNVDVSNHASYLSVSYIDLTDDSSGFLLFKHIWMKDEIAVMEAASELKGLKSLLMSDATIIDWSNRKGVK